MQHGNAKWGEFERQVLLSNGGLRYRVDGDGPGTLFLIHGVGSSSGTWWRLRPLLTDRYRVVSYDLRGHGGSQHRPRPWTIDDFARDHLSLVAELGPPRSHLLGFSLGAQVAMAVALRAPEAVDHLVLLNCAGARDKDDRAKVASRLAQVKASRPAETAATSAARWFTSGFLREQPEAVQREVNIVSTTDATMYAAAYEVLATTDLVDQAQVLGPPVLLVTGEDDGGSTPRMSRALASRIPKATVEVLPGLRHYLHIEAAESLADLVKGFLDQSGGSRRKNY